MGSEVKRWMRVLADPTGCHTKTPSMMVVHPEGRWVDWDDYASLAAKLERAEAVLRGVEWGGPRRNRFWPQCPACRGHKNSSHNTKAGHSPDCALSAIINPKEPPHAP